MTQRARLVGRRKARTVGRDRAMAFGCRCWPDLPSVATQSAGCASGQPGVGSPRCGGVVTSSSARLRRRSVVVRSWRERRMLPAATPPSRAGDGTSPPGVDPMEGAVRQAARPRRRRQRARDPGARFERPQPKPPRPSNAHQHHSWKRPVPRSSGKSNRHSTVARGCKTYCINNSMLS